MLAVLDDSDIVDNVFPAGFFVIHHFHPFFFLSFFPAIRLSSRRFLALGTELQGDVGVMITDPASETLKWKIGIKTLKYMDEKLKGKLRMGQE